MNRDFEIERSSKLDLTGIKLVDGKNKEAVKEKVERKSEMSLDSIISEFEKLENSLKKFIDNGQMLARRDGKNKPSKGIKQAALLKSEDNKKVREKKVYDFSSDRQGGNLVSRIDELVA